MKEVVVKFAMAVGFITVVSIGFGFGAWYGIGAIILSYIACRLIERRL